MRSALVAIAIAWLVASSASAQAAKSKGSKPPDFPVDSSCKAAEQFSGGGPEAQKKDYDSCMRDETTAKQDLGKRWNTFKAVDKKQCEEQQPNPSYVEMLTCLEMDTSRTVGNTQVPQIGGPVAPGLSTGPGAPQ